MLTKQDLDQKVALATGAKKSDVEEITNAFIDELCNALAHHGGFQLDGLGKLVPQIERSAGGRIPQDSSQEAVRVRLYFTKSRMLREQLNRQFGIKESSHAE